MSEVMAEMSDMPPAGPMPFGHYIHQVVSLIDKRGDEMFRTRLGLSLRQFMLLRLVEAEVPSQQALAERLGIAKSAISRHIYIAQNKGWLKVSATSASRRQTSLILTDEGKRLLAKAKKLIEESEAQGFGDVPQADLQTTIRTLKFLHKKLNSSAK
jgi:DNA-binding MarR family transcriptional regulator